jgi:putative endopeptidase
MKDSFVRFAYACTFLALLTSGFAQTQPAMEPDHGVRAQDIDRSIKPGDNFFEYSNGEWIKRTEIPPDRGSLTVFSLLNDVAVKRTSGLIEEIAKSNSAPGTGNRKIADLYASYMDESGIEARGMAPLKPHIDEIYAIHFRKDLARYFGETLRADVDPLNNTNFHTSNVLGLWVAPDFSDSDHYTAYIMQGGIELPDRDYYLSNSEHHEGTAHAVSGARRRDAQAGGILRR